ncbi:DUF4767 domain-containing protein [Streptococcus rifensis]
MARKQRLMLIVKGLFLLFPVAQSLLIIGTNLGNQSGGQTLSHQGHTHFPLASKSTTNKSPIVGHVHQTAQTTPDTPWNLSKAENLRQKLMTYRPVGQGNYKEYFMGNGIDWQGTELPKGLVQEKGQTLVDGKAQNFHYSQTAEQPGWHIVAVFSNQEDPSAELKHTYLFIIANGQGPIVLEPQGREGNQLHLTSQVDQEVQALFKSVVDGER